MLGLIMVMTTNVAAQQADTALSRHNFFYAGQSKQRRMFIVKDGQVSWSYDDKLKRGEISDAVLMSDGHILVAHQYGVAEVTQDQQTVWSYAALEGTEIHTIQPIGRRHVVFVQNGKPAKAVVMEIPACRIVREFELPINEKGSVHGQFRNARLSSRGTLLVANMAMGCIHEFTSDGKMARGLAKCIVDADYLINSALLKTHSGPGVTLTTKNWYGATDINLLWRQNAHNNVSQDKRNGKPQYKTFVDWMTHKNMGQKALLFLIDGTYGSRDVNGAPNPKWMKEPFNGDWACSIIVSQDEVACDAVGMDIIINEWPEFGSLNYCDEYLREAASLPNAPSGTVYKQGGKPVEKPLGLFEHWNKEHQYKKIELRYKKL